MAYELKELGWYDEDIKLISATILEQTMTITIELQNGNTLDTTVTLPDATSVKVTGISNAIAENKLTTTVTLSDGTSVNSAAVDLPTTDISGKQDKAINLTGFIAKTVEGALTEAKAAGETAATNLTTHIGDKENPHGVTAAQIGLGNVENTSDADKPVSTAQQAALDAKLDKVETTTTTTQAYVKTANGSQAMLDVGGTASENIALVGQTEPYHITLTGDTGNITREQYDKLKADDRAYVHETNYDVILIKTQDIGSDLFFDAVHSDSLYSLRVSTIDLSYRLRLSTLERTINKVDEITGTGDVNEYPSTKAVVDYVKENAEITTNKTTTVNVDSTDTQYPSAKATYTYGQTVLTSAKSYTDTQVGNINTLLTALNTGEGV